VHDIAVENSQNVGAGEAAPDVGSASPVSHPQGVYSDFTG